MIAKTAGSRLRSASQLLIGVGAVDTVSTVVVETALPSAVLLVPRVLKSGFKCGYFFQHSDSKCLVRLILTHSSLVQDPLGGLPLVAVIKTLLDCGVLYRIISLQASVRSVFSATMVFPAFQFFRIWATKGS